MDLKRRLLIRNAKLAPILSHIKPTRLKLRYFTRHFKCI